MTRTHLIAAGIVVAGALTAAIITIFVLFYYQPGRQTHDIAMPEDTAVRVVLEPARIQRYVSSLAPGISRFVSGVPKVTSMQSRAFRVDWVHALPYEIALLLSEPKDNTLDALLYINAQPESSFLDEFNAWGALREIRGIAWESGSAREITPEYATATGHIAINGTWNANAPKASVHALGRPKVDRGHWLEVSAANAGDVLSHLHAAMDRAWGQPGSPESAEALNRVLPDVRRVHLTGDLSADDALSFTLTVVLQNPEAQGALDNAMTAVADTMAASFAERWGWSFGGGYAWTGPATVEGAYTLRGFEKDIRRALGN